MNFGAGTLPFLPLCFGEVKMANPRMAAALAAGVMSLPTAACAGQQMVAVAGQGAGPVRIVWSGTAETGETARYLAGWLRARGWKCTVALGKPYLPTCHGAQWIVGTQGSLKALKAPGKPVSFQPSSRDEAYVLDVRREKNGPVVVLAGKTPSGVRAAAARVIGKSANTVRSLLIPAGREETDPFIKLRLMNVGQAARRQASPGSPFQDANYETWKPERIRAYPEMIWQLGFNGIQVDECRGYGSVHGEELTRVRRAVQTVSKGAKDYRMYVSFSQWGDCLFVEGETFSWNNPKERQVMVDFMKDLAKAYAPTSDNVVIRIGDPGGCTRDGCDFYKTPQQITAAFLQEFRRVNPSVTGTLSVWANSALWLYAPRRLDMSNYGPMFPDMAKQTEFGRAIPDGGKFLDETFMPRDVSISLNRIYNQDQAEMVLSCGRPVDIKGWYIGDMEMINNVTLTMHAVDTLFSRLPDKAREQVRSQTVEMCFHGWPQVINHYVAAQKLINPRRPLQQIEREFCAAAFGPANADAMVDLYNACENGDVDTYILPIARPADFGTAAYNQRLQGVLARAQKVQLAPGFKPNFAFPVPAQKYIDMLRARLTLSLAVSEAKQAVDEARRTAASPAEAEAAVKDMKEKCLTSLPYLPIDPLYHQDASVVNPSYKTLSFAEMIEKL